MLSKTLPLLQSLKPKQNLQTILVGATALSIGVTAAIVYFPWLWLSNKNIDELTLQINQVTAQNISSELSTLFNSSTASQTFLQQVADRNVFSIDRRDVIEPIFLSILEANPQLTWSMIGYPNGDFLGAQRINDKTLLFHRRQWNPQTNQSQRTITSYEIKGRSLSMIKQESEQEKRPFYAPDRPWYKEAVKNPGQPSWTTYVRRTNNQPTVDSAVVLEKSGSFIGVLNLGFDLDRVSRFLQKLQKHPKSILFITNQKGQVLASSDLQEVTPQQKPGQDEPQLNLLEASKNPLMVGIAQEVKAKNGGSFNMNGIQNLRYWDTQSNEMYYATLIPLNQLDWKIGIVNPESLYLGEIRRNELILIGCLTLVILIILTIAIRLTKKLLVNPILKLNHAAHQVAEQKFSERELQDLLDRPDEIGELTQTLIEMAEQIDGRERGLRDQVKSLKRQTEEARQTSDSLNAQSQSLLLEGGTNPIALLQRAKQLRQSLKADLS